MLYGLYLSASGVMANTHRQDVIANNLANSETIGFKRLLSGFQQRLTAEQTRPAGLGDPMLEPIGGGLLLSPTSIDPTQGELDATGGRFDLALQGPGYFAVQDAGRVRFTRDGRFMLDNAGRLVLANGSGHPVLDAEMNPIVLDPALVHQTTVGVHGEITQNGLAASRIGLFESPEPARLRRLGGNLLDPGATAYRAAEQTRVASGFLERSNVNPAAELTRMMEALRQLEANANMIRYQDQTLGRLVSEVARIE